MVNTSMQNNLDTPKLPTSRKSSAPKRKASARKSGKAVKATGRKAQGISARLYRQGRDAMSGAYDAAAGIGSSLPKIPSKRQLRKQGQSVYAMVENRPLIFGAVGLGVGMALAALIPSMNSRSSHR